MPSQPQWSRDNRPCNTLPMAALHGVGWEAKAFVLANTLPARAPLVPEIALHLANEVTPIWRASEEWLRERNVEPPFWAFAWPGGQALARYVLDHPGSVAGRRVLDSAAGCGIAAIACALAGAAAVEAAEIDKLAGAAIRLNAALNSVRVTVLPGDVVGSEWSPRTRGWDLILCGDICYEAPMTRHILPWLRRMAEHTEVWVADPGRAYLPSHGLTRFAECRVPTTLDLEDRLERLVTLFRLDAQPNEDVRRARGNPEQDSYLVRKDLPR